MNNGKAHLASSFLDVLIRYLDTRGFNQHPTQQYLQQLALTPRLSADEFSKTLEQIYQLDPVPALGLRIGLMAKPENFGLVGYLLTSCSTLQQALKRYGRFQTLVQSELVSIAKAQGNTISHQWHLSQGESELAHEFGVAVFINLYQTLIDKPVAPAKVGLPIPEPADPYIYEAILGCPVEFNAPAIRVDIPSHVMLMSIASRDPYLLRILDQQAAAMLDQNNHRSESFEEFLQQLKQQLLAAMKDGDTRASIIAEKMGYPLRSFYRKLSDNGHNYRHILADSRQRLAKQYLADPSLSPSEVALLLGYSEQSAFIRAFKGWMGMTPGEWRTSRDA